MLLLPRFCAKIMVTQTCKEHLTVTTWKHPTSLLLTVEDPTRPLEVLLNEKSMTLEIKASNDLINLLETTGFTRRGKTMWALPINRNTRAVSQFFTTYNNEFTPQTMISLMGEQSARNLKTFWPNGQSQLAYSSPKAHPAFFQTDPFFREMNAVDGYRWSELAMPENYTEDKDDFMRLLRRRTNATAEITQLRSDYATLGGVAVSLTNDTVWVRLIGSSILANSHGDKIQLPTLPNTRVVKAVAQTPQNVVTLLDGFQRDGYVGLFDTESNPALELLEKAEDAITVGYSPNEPAGVVLTIGKNVTVKKSPFTKTADPGQTKKATLKQVLELKKKNPKAAFFMHPALDDIVNMTKAKPYTGDPRLKPFQKEAVGLHLSTSIGYLQTCSPGMGKTVIQLASMRARAKDITNYRGMVVCEAGLRHQWEEEAEVWFPEATVVNLKSKNDTDKLAEALAVEGPVLVIMSYTQSLLVHQEDETRNEEKETLSTLTFAKKLEHLAKKTVPEMNIGQLALDTFWDDLCADEAVIIRNGSSKQSKALWSLRRNAQVATALTATPINKEPNDLARLVAWARNDPSMFQGTDLMQKYNPSTAAGAKKMFDMFGPIIFRRDTSEMKNEMPTPLGSVLKLKPSPAEKALATAAERELRRCYLELVAAVDELKNNEATAEEIEVVKENLKQANRAWLGGKQLARMATSDAAALNNSDSVGAALLAGQGLIEAAMVDQPTKQAAFIKEAQKRILNGQQVVVFTSFIEVANLLVKALQEVGINAKGFTGKNGSVRDRARREFQNGELDVLVCTTAGERGLTLHKAALLVHYDLPWTAERITQRTGRIVRIGSEHPTVDVIFFILEGTIEDHMAEHLVKQGVVASLTLDHSRGINIAKTDTGNAMSGLISSNAKTSKDADVIAYGKILYAAQKEAA
jgi:hypothetical protein